MHYKRVLVECVLPTAFFLGMLGCNSDRAREEATWKYWESMNGMNQKYETTIKDIEAKSKTATTPEEFSSVLRQSGEYAKRARNDIHALPVLNVDEELVSYASSAAEMMYQGESLVMDFAIFLDDVKRFNDETNSVGAVFESFVRGVFGDPLGTMNDVKTRGNRLDVRREEFLKRWEGFQKRMSELSAQEIKVRATLSQRYGREFKTHDHE